MAKDTKGELAGLPAWEAEAFGRWLAGEAFEDYEDDYDSSEGELHAEFISSWVAGGGLASDAERAWNSGIAHRNGYACAPEGDYEERPDWLPRYGSPEWEAYELAMDERDYLDELAGY
jgi:hypothetical protein